MARLLRSTHVRLVATVLVAALAATALIGRDDQAQAIDPGVDVVYVADGRNFADALVGAVIAAMNNTSVLTVAGTNSGDFVPGATKDELTRLKPAKIVILGGSAAVSNAVETELGTYTTPTADNTERLFGTDRFGTAAAISAALPDAIQRALFAEKAGDADTLDGMDSGDFLGATEQAVDSARLDGMDSGAFARTLDIVEVTAPLSTANQVQGEALGVATCPDSHRAISGQYSIDREFENETSTNIPVYVLHSNRAVNSSGQESWVILVQTQRDRFPSGEVSVVCIRLESG